MCGFSVAMSRLKFGVEIKMKQPNSAFSFFFGVKINYTDELRIVLKSVKKWTIGAMAGQRLVGSVPIRSNTL